MSRILKLYPVRRCVCTSDAVIDWKNHKNFLTTQGKIIGKSTVTIKDTETITDAGFFCIEFCLPNGLTCRFPLCEGSKNPNERQDPTAVSVRRTEASRDVFERPALFFTEEVIHNARSPYGWRRGSLYRR